MGTQTIIEPVDIARLAVDVASEKLASDIMMLDIRGIADFCDYFVILTADSPRQIDALWPDLEDALEAIGVGLHHREGTSEHGWVLLDFVDIIVHLFLPEQREFYQIEEAWSEGTKAVRIQ